MNHTPQNYNQQVIPTESHTPNSQNRKGNYPPSGPNKNNQRNNGPNPLQQAGRNDLGLNNQNTNMNSGDQMMDMQNYNNMQGVNNSGYNKTPPNMGQQNMM